MKISILDRTKKKFLGEYRTASQIDRFAVRSASLARTPSATRSLRYQTVENTKGDYL